jgi:hypothetical protein
MPLLARLTLVVLAAAAYAATGWGQERSPFEPAGTAAAPPPVTGSPLDRFELRGIMTIGTQTFVTLFDTSTSKSLTLAPGETLEGVKASDFRPDEDSVRIESSGQSRRLKLKEAKIVALAVPPPTAPPPPGGPVQVAAGQPPVPGPTMTDEEARTRMQRVAEEIRRRREMRRQMLEQQRTNPGQPTN